MPNGFVASGLTCLPKKAPERSPASSITLPPTTGPSGQPERGVKVHDMPSEPKAAMTL